MKCHCKTYMRDTWVNIFEEEQQHTIHTVLSPYHSNSSQVPTSF